MHFRNLFKVKKNHVGLEFMTYRSQFDKNRFRQVIQICCYKLICTKHIIRRCLIIFNFFIFYDRDMNGVL